MDYDILIMAAGLGKRMNSTIPKPIIPILDKPMLLHILDTISTLSTLPNKLYVIVYYLHSSSIISACADKLPANLVNRIVWLVQNTEPSGTGSSVQEAIIQIPTSEISSLVILSSDVPMISKNTIEYMLDEYNGSSVILTDYIENPYGYGRILEKDNHFISIVEEKDASPTEKLIKIVNTGIYCIKYSFLRNQLFMITNNNASGEYYLTDLFGILKNENVYVRTLLIKKSTPYELFNINTKSQLQELENMLILV